MTMLVFQKNRRCYSVSRRQLLLLLIILSLVAIFDISVRAQENPDGKPLLSWQIQGRAGGSLELDPWEIAKRTQERAQQAITKALGSTRIGPRSSSSSSISDGIQSRSSGALVSNIDETDDNMYEALRQEEEI
jgi:hypothetical protein